MSKDYAQIANDVVTGIGLLRQGAPDTVKAFGSLSTWWGILSLGDIARRRGHPAMHCPASPSLAASIRSRDGGRDSARAKA